MSARPWQVIAWAALAILLIAGIAGQVVRPVAPDLGAVPDPLRWFAPELLARIESYRAPARLVAIMALVIRVAVPVLIASTGWGRRQVLRLGQRIGAQRPAVSAACVIVAVVVLVDVIVLPLAFWRGFIHEHAFGLSTQSAPGWLGDWLLMAVPVWLLTAVLAAGGYGLAWRLPDRWYLIAAPSAALLAVVLVWLGPLLLEPLRFNTRPLGPGPTRTAIEVVIAASGARVTDIVVADASRRTVRQNAYVSGLGTTRRVVLYDNLLERPTEEIVVIFAHELAHDRNRDVLRGALLGATGVIFCTLAIAGFLRCRVATGRQDQVADLRGAASIVALVMLLQALSLPLQSLASRRAEAAADLGALELTQDPATFASMMQGLAARNLSDPAPPGWVYLLWSSHPPTTSRLLMAERWAEGSIRASQSTESRS